MSAAAFPSAATVDLFRAALRALGQEQPLSRRTPRSVEALGPLRGAGDPQTLDSEKLAACVELRAALRALCDEARAESLRAEQLLVVFKQTWFSLPEVRALDHDEQRGILLSRVLGLCLDEYYGMRG
ncbi:MAG: hypothetical protein M3081_08365 [Gemmatimonadota bacterium]|nr:hypothetical protein [Gemmatimonadota bacterium]